MWKHTRWVINVVRIGTPLYVIMFFIYFFWMVVNVCTYCLFQILDLFWIFHCPPFQVTSEFIVVVNEPVCLVKNIHCYCCYLFCYCSYIGTCIYVLMVVLIWVLVCLFFLLFGFFRKGGVKKYPGKISRRRALKTTRSKTKFWLCQNLNFCTKFFN